MQNYRLLVDHMQDMVFVLEVGEHGMFVIRDANKAACVAHGYQSDELIGRPMSVLSPDCNPDNVKKVCDFLGNSAGSYLFPARHLRKDGTPIEAEVRIQQFETGKKLFSTIVRDVTELRRMQRKMAMLAHALDNVHEVVYLADESGKLCYVNKTVSNHSGYSAEELLEMKLSDLNPEILPGTWPLIFNDIRQKKSFVYEGRYRTKDGRIVPVEISRNYFRYEDDEFIFGFVRDITGRKQTEEALKESEHKYRIVAEYAADWEFWLGPDGRFLYVSPACQQISGYGAREFYDNPDLMNEIVHPDDKEILEHHCTVRGNCLEDISYRICCKDKKIKWLHHVCQPVFDSHGKFIGIRGSNRDITALKKTERCLATRLQLREFALDHGLDEVIGKALELVEMMTCSTISFFHFIELDQKTITLQAWSPNTINKMCSMMDDCRGKHYMLEDAGVWADAIRERKPIIHNDYKGLAHRKGIPAGHVDLTRELVIPIFKGADIVAVLGVGNKPYDYDEADIVMLSDFCCVFWDAVQQKKFEQERDELESQLRQAQKMEAIGTLAGGIAHDFNNILSILIGFTELANMKLPENSSIRPHLNKVLQAGDRAKDLVRQILTFSRRGEQERQPLQLNLLVKESMKLLRASIPATIKIIEKIDPATGYVNADPTQMHQILMNLCTNAYHAMKHTGGELAISLKQVRIELNDVKVNGFSLFPGDYARLEVSDTGCGMNKATLERIFEPYFTTKPKDEGTGLGLAVVHGIVKDSGGHVSVYSEEGKGTTFRVYLPTVKMGSTAQDRVHEALPRGTQSILAVDDDATLLEMTKSMLEGFGYSVAAFSDSRQALEAFCETPMAFDLIVTDMTMPELTGLDLFLGVRRVRADMPVVMCTGFSELIDKEKAISLGISEFLEKPLSQRALAEAVARALGNQGDASVNVVE